MPFQINPTKLLTKTRKLFKEGEGHGLTQALHQGSGKLEPLGQIQEDDFCNL